jgi:hypothetical protein
MSGIILPAASWTSRKLALAYRNVLAPSADFHSYCGIYFDNFEEIW